MTDDTEIAQLRSNIVSRDILIESLHLEADRLTKTVIRLTEYAGRLRDMLSERDAEIDTLRAIIADDEEG